MRHWGLGLAVLGTAGLMVAGMVPADATVTAPRQVVAASNVQSTVFAQRYFSCYEDYGCSVTATLPKTWRYVKLNTNEFRFLDRRCRGWSGSTSIWAATSPRRRRSRPHCGGPVG